MSLGLISRPCETAKSDILCESFACEAIGLVVIVLVCAGLATLLEWWLGK